MEDARKCVSLLRANKNLRVIVDVFILTRCLLHFSECVEISEFLDAISFARDEFEQKILRIKFLIY